MIQCDNLTILNEYQATCSLIEIPFAGPSSPHFICKRCVEQWQDGSCPKTVDESTPVMIEFKERHSPSRGLGDTIAKFTHATGIDKVVEAIAGKDCGCKGRQEALNRLVPYKEPRKESQ